MLNNKPTKYIQKVYIPKSLLWIIWLFLFLLPSTLSITSFKLFQNEYLYFIKSNLISSSFERLKKYNDFIIPENFLKTKLQSVKEINTKQEIEAIKKEIDKILCCETMLCMFFDKNNTNAQIIKNPKASISSANFLKTSIINYLKTMSSNTKEKDIKDSQFQLATRLQMLFKTPTNITIELDNISVNFSVMYEGELYFFLIKFEKPSKDISSLFCVIRGKDFFFKKMLENLNYSFPEARIVFKEININKNMEEELSPDVKPNIYCGLKQEKNNLFILAPANARFARHILHHGTADLNLKYGNLFPYIEFHIPIEKEIYYLNKIRKIINFIATFIILFSAVLFLHISLFDFNPKWKFKSKIIALIILSAIIPFSIFTLGIYSIESFNRFISKISIEHHAILRLQMNNSELENYITKLETDLNEFTKILVENLEIPELTANDFSKLLSQLEEKIPLSKEAIFLNPLPNNLKTLLSQENEESIIRYIPERLSNEGLVDEDQAVILKIPSTVLEYVNEEKIQSREAKNTFIAAGQEIESTEINESLLDTGKLNKLSSAETISWFSIHQLHKRNSKKIIGILCTKFEPRPILDFYLRESYLAKKGFREIKNNYEINYAFLPIANSGTAKIWNGSGNISQEIREICLNNSHSKQFNINNQTIITKQNQIVPHLAVAIIKELHQYNEISFVFKTILSIILYLLLIVSFSNKLLDIIFVNPVMKLASNALQIAQGGEEWNTEIKSGDEFEDLNNNFKNLVTGLKERNILKSYVSEDAFSDIEKCENLKLLPGGEYIEATIVFSALKEYNILSKKISPQESIQLLSKFMSISEEVTKEFGGSIDKIIGDTIMLVFRNNPTLPSHGLRGAQAALKLVEKAKAIGLPSLYTGIASGKVISGKIGSYSGKLDFTVIGNPVNLAARFKTESKNGTEETGIIISGITIGLTQGKAIVKFLRRVSIKGKARQYNIYELIGINVK